MEQARQYYTVNDIIEILPIGRNGVYQLVQNEHFPKIKLGKKIVIPAKKFHEWIDENLGQVIELS